MVEAGDGKGPWVVTGGRLGAFVVDGGMYGTSVVVMIGGWDVEGVIVGGGCFVGVGVCIGGLEEKSGLPVEEEKSGLAVVVLYGIRGVVLGLAVEVVPSGYSQATCRTKIE